MHCLPNVLLARSRCLSRFSSLALVSLLRDRFWIATRLVLGRGRRLDCRHARDRLPDPSQGLPLPLTRSGAPDAQGSGARRPGTAESLATQEQLLLLSFCDSTVSRASSRLIDTGSAWTGIDVRSADDTRMHAFCGCLSSRGDASGCRLGVTTPLSLRRLGPIECIASPTPVSHGPASVFAQPTTPHALCGCLSSGDALG